MGIKGKRWNKEMKNAKVRDRAYGKKQKKQAKFCMVRGKADWQKVSFSRHILDYWAPYTFTVFQTNSSNFLWFFPHLYSLDFIINEKNFIIAHKASPVAQRWRICLQCRRSRRCWFHPGVRKIPWRRRWQPTPVFLMENTNGQRSLMGYSP